MVDIAGLFVVDDGRDTISGCFGNGDCGGVECFRAWGDGGDLKSDGDR